MAAVLVVFDPKCIPITLRCHVLLWSMTEGCRALSGHLSKRAQRDDAADDDDETSDATGPTEADAVAAKALEVAAEETPAEQAAQLEQVSWAPLSHEAGGRFLRH